MPGSAIISVLMDMVVDKGEGMDKRVDEPQAEPVEAPRARTRVRKASRRVAEGDTAASLKPAKIAEEVVARRVSRKQEDQSSTLGRLLAEHRRKPNPGGFIGQLKTLMDGASPDEQRALRKLLRPDTDKRDPGRIDPDV